MLLQCFCSVEGIFLSMEDVSFQQFALYKYMHVVEHISLFSFYVGKNFVTVTCSDVCTACYSFWGSET